MNLFTRNSTGIILFSSPISSLKNVERVRAVAAPALEAERIPVGPLESNVWLEAEIETEIETESEIKMLVE